MEKRKPTLDLDSIKAEFSFVDYQNPANWCRYTTYGGSTGWQPERNPVIAEANDPVGALYDSSAVTLWMKGVPEPASLSLLALGGLVLLRRR